jgi:hypothetical protein
MLDLFTIVPPGKLESTIGGLTMFFMQSLNLMDVSDDACLGGHFSTFLRGPTSAALVAPVANVLNPPPAIPLAAAFHLPVGTRPSPPALDPANWRV